MRIDKVDVVAAFQVDPNTPLKLGAALSSMADQHGAQLTPLTIAANAPPSLPRFIVSIEQSIIQIALDRVQLSVSPPKHINNSKEEVFKFLHAEVQRLLLPLVNLPWMAEQWSGVLVTVRYPNALSDAGAASAAAVAAAQITNLSWAEGDLKAFQLLIGREVNGYYRGFTVSGYETRTLNLEFKLGASVIKVNPAEHPIDDSGLSVSLDVNNKPMLDRPGNEKGVMQVIGEAELALQNMMRDLNLAEIA